MSSKITTCKTTISRGSYLFPTVFGLEAMAQAVALVVGRSTLGRVTAKDIELSKPIVVDKSAGLTIRIHALRLEQATEQDPARVKASVRTETGDFAVDSFSAVFEFGDAIEASAREPTSNEHELSKGRDALELQKLILMMRCMEAFFSRGRCFSACVLYIILIAMNAYFPPCTGTPPDGRWETLTFATPFFKALSFA